MFRWKLAGGACAAPAPELDSQAMPMAGSAAVGGVARRHVR